jgi:hypothetical protein
MVRYIYQPRSAGCGRQRFSTLRSAYDRADYLARQSGRKPRGQLAWPCADCDAWHIADELAGRRR